MSAYSEEVARLFEDAVELGPEDRARFLADLGARDADLRDELDALLASHAAAPDFLDRLAAAVLPGAMRGLAPPGPAGVVPDLEPGRTVGRYRIVRRLGTGGMGVVYEAFDPELNRPVALKFLAERPTGDPEARRRLIEEARAASALDHPNIEVVHEIGRVSLEAGEAGGRGGDRLYIAMAYYPGRTLREILAEGPRRTEEIVDIGRQLAAGLQRAHEAGIVHRDIKPANLVVTDRGRVKIVDFGIASLAAGSRGESATRGTVAYMSPEQARGRPVDARSDVWSAGVVLYEMLAGRRPFRGEDDAEVLRAIRDDVPDPLERLRPGTPAALTEVVERCLAKDPGARFADGGALGDALAAVAPTSAMVDADASPRYGARRFAVAVAIAGLFVLAAAWVLTRTAGISPAASRLVVLPLTAAAPDDSVLGRLGGDLAVTLGAALDGIGTLRTVDPTTVLAQLSRSGGPVDADDARALALRLGAGGVLVGSLAGDRSAVRAEVRLLATGDSAILASASATAAAGDVAAMTDALAVALVRQFWRGRDAPVPSIAAVTTGSAAALRHYVEGEQAMSAGDMPRAVEAFEAAFRADSTFWIAYWRSLYPRAWYGTPAADSAATAAVIAHRHELPEPDRRMIEARLAGSLSQRLDALGALTHDFPDYWPAAYDLANLRIHFAPLLGGTLDESRAAIERAVALNPNFVPAWEHLLMVAPLQRDSVRYREALDELRRRVDESDPYWVPRLAVADAVLRALRRNGELTAPDIDALLPTLQAEAERYPRFDELRAGLFFFHGFAALQARLNDETLSSLPDLTRSSRAILHMANAHVWATRGAWDSAAVSVDRWLAWSDDPTASLRVYGLGVVVGVVEGWPIERVRRMRRSATAAAAEGDAEDRAELAWLDGVLAWLSRDPEALAAARRAVRASGGWKAEELDRSLAAFESALAGETAEAARQIEAIERESADAYIGNGFGGTYRHLSAIHRFHAVPWLLAAGDSAAARRLLRWHEGVPPGYHGPRVGWGNSVLVPYLRLHQARLEAERGRAVDASRHLRAILETVDRPSSGSARRLRDEAATALAALRGDT